MATSPLSGPKETMQASLARVLEPLTEKQQWVVDVIGEAFWSENFTWPTLMYVEAEMDRRGVDLREALATFPIIGGSPGQTYSAISSLPQALSMNENQELHLSLLGLWHCEKPLRSKARTAVADVIGLLNTFVVVRRSWRPNPTTVIKPEFTSKAALESLRQRAPGGFESYRGTEKYARLLFQLMEGEPCFKGGNSAIDETRTEWKWIVDRSVLQFREISTIEQYVERLAILYATVAIERRSVPSPLDLPTSLGYLDLAWRITHEREHLLSMVSPEKVASLAFDAGSREEFFDRLSALCEMMKGFRVPQSSTETGHPITRMKHHLKEILPAEAHARVSEATGVLSSLITIRNGGQHGGVQDKAAVSWIELGAHLPILDWANAWSLTRQRAIAAFDAIREELLAVAD